jgi:hypothetical protein
MPSHEADSVWARCRQAPNWADWKRIPRIPWNLFWDEIVARVAEAAGIDRPGEALAGKVRAQLCELYGADLVGVR